VSGGAVRPWVEIAACGPGIARVRCFAGERSDVHSYLAGLAPAVSGGDASACVRRTADALEFLGGSGECALRLNFADMSCEGGPHLRLTLIGEQHFYGLGESGQQFDRLGATRRLWNSQANHGSGADVAIPLLLSTASYALFFDNSSQGLITVGDSVGPAAAIEYRAAEGPLDLYVIQGADLRETLERATALLGRAPMVPRWALGFMQSTRHFDDVEDLLAVTRTMRAKRLPCDAFIFLSTYGPGQGWNRGVGHLEFHPDLIEEPAAVIGEMRSAGFHVFGHEYPVLHADSPLYEEAAAKGYLLDYGYPDQRPFGTGVVNYREGQRFIDFSQPGARRWWWEAHRPLVDLGIDGWWLDGGEGPPATTQLHGGPGVALHNRFDLMRHQAFAEGEARDRPTGRAFLLCRSGGPGMQRFGAAAWSGDIDCSFATLEQQVAVGLNMAMSGVPYWGTDIGGFYQVAAADPELFVRWFQFGAFCPVFRAHGHSWRDHLPWSHGPETEAICRRYIELRYRLLPYTYTLAWQAHRLGLPLMRPMVLGAGADLQVWQMGSQYFWGDDLLVAPVTRAGATHWPVYLPEGTWYDFWTQLAYQGPCAVTVEAPLDRLPLFVREGAIVPLGPIRQFEGDVVADTISLLIYPAARGSAELYDDDGATTRYRDGGYAVTAVNMTQADGSLRIDIAAPRGDPASVSPSRRYALQIRAARAPRSVAGAADGWSHDGTFVHLALSGHPATVTVEW
jgi:alpha-glucosidase